MDLTIKGRVKLACFDSKGNKKWDTGWLKNTIMNVGLNEITGLMGNIGSKTAFSYIAVGTGDTTEAKTQTALVTEVTDSGLARASVTPTQETTTVTNDTLQFYKEWTATATKTIEEVGIFNAASAGTMLGRKLTGSKALTSGDVLKGTYQIILS